VLKLRDGTNQLSTGLSTTAVPGAAQLAAGLTTAHSGASALAGGAKQVDTGAQQLAAGSAQPDDGLKSAGSKVPALLAGLTQVDGGLAKIDAGLAQLQGSAGLAKTAADGAPALADGAGQLSAQGTSVLVSNGKETAADYGVKYAVIEAGAQRAADEDMAYGAPSGAAGATAYSIEIAGVDGAGAGNVGRGFASIALFGIGSVVATLARRRFL
jgi:putative membrane protein